LRVRVRVGVRVRVRIRIRVRVKVRDRVRVRVRDRVRVRVRLSLPCCESSYNWVQQTGFIRRCDHPVYPRSGLYTSQLSPKGIQIMH
jgi:hypothetical protein